MPSCILKIPYKNQKEINTSMNNFLLNHVRKLFLFSLSSVSSAKKKSEHRGRAGVVVRVLGGSRSRRRRRDRMHRLAAERVIEFARFVAEGVGVPHDPDD